MRTRLGRHRYTLCGKIPPTGSEPNYYDRLSLVCFSASIPERMNYLPLSRLGTRKPEILSFPYWDGRMVISSISYDEVVVLLRPALSLLRVCADRRYLDSPLFASIRG